MSADLATLVSNSLRTLLSETMLRADKQAAYIINQGEPGLVDTLKFLSAKKASTSPRAGGKPIVSHANHVLYGLDIVNRAMRGDQTAFAHADWNVAWKLVQVSDSEWAELIDKLERTANDVIDIVTTNQQWDEISFTGCFASAGHAAYHLGAIRQMLRDLERAE
ncbi:hypothetical protein ETAA8_27490 [Anatilimnocola aggregata]|uniref:DinB-like domain-containing protein n=1 Tax=Anatilimnocola aggregata TaxID=2528021 RepID=A0A517YBN9_9BACT|nr:hypothetical protein [Anatilimnocola aggregata]QDU27660.1 hypothetical protein ETAA8_27490 [Anatilimnocola aggregata]